MALGERRHFFAEDGLLACVVQAYDLAAISSREQVPYLRHDRRDAAARTDRHESQRCRIRKNEAALRLTQDDDVIATCRARRPGSDASTGQSLDRDAQW